MSHNPPCTYGFAGSMCPECQLLDANRRMRLEVEHRLVELNEGEVREALSWFLRHDLDALRDALTETGVA